MRFFRRTSVLQRAIPGVAGTSMRHCYYYNPRFSPLDRYVLPTCTDNNNTSYANLDLTACKNTLEEIRKTKACHQDELNRLFAEIGRLKKVEDALSIQCQDIFNKIFYKFTEQWIAVGKKLIDTPLANRFEVIHDDLVKVLTLNSLNRRELTAILARAQHFLTVTCAEKKEILGKPLETAITSLELLINYLNRSSIPREKRLIEHEYAQGQAYSAAH